MFLELKDVSLRAGDELKIKGQIPCAAERFEVNLGVDPENVALHFNPRFADGAVLVLNSRTSVSWGEERRDIPLERGTLVKMVFRHVGEKFVIQLSDGRSFVFPNRLGLITYVNISGHFRLTSFDMF